MAPLKNFVGGSYLAPSVNAASDRAQNLFPEVIESGTGANVAMLRGTPGLAQLLLLPYGPIRGLWAGGAPLSGAARLFAAAGASLYEIHSNWTYTLLGSIADDATHTPVQMFPNGNQLAVIASGYFYVHDGVSLSQPNFISASGFLSTVGTAVTWAEGTLFSSGWVGSQIRIGGIGGPVFFIQSWTDATHMTLLTSAGTQTDVEFTMFLGSPVTATTGAFLDGYAIAATPNSKTFQLSGINEFGEWDPLDSAIKQSYPDNIGAVLADHEELYLFGESTIEVWRDTGGSGTNSFPFQRDPGACMSIGTGAPWSCVSTRDGVAWIKADLRGGPAAYFAKGYQPQRVSTHAIEAAWAAYSTVMDAQSFVYELDGHEFWQINFPAANATWVYDFTASAQMGKHMWHEKTSAAVSRSFTDLVIVTANTITSVGYSFVAGDVGSALVITGGTGFTVQTVVILSVAAGVATVSTSPGTPGSGSGIGFMVSPSPARHRARCHAFVWGQHVVGDYASGKVYAMSTATYDESGLPIFAVRTCPHLNAERLMHFFPRLVVNLETTTSATSTLLLDWSDDAGHTWYAPAIALTIPAVYDYLAYFNRLGKSRDRVFRLTWVGLVKKALIDVSLD